MVLMESANNKRPSSQSNESELISGKKPKVQATPELLTPDPNKTKEKITNKPNKSAQSSMIELIISQGMRKDWLTALEPEFEKHYFKNIQSFLKSSTFTVYPPSHELYEFSSCPLDQVKVVILGQDPYHGPGQAHGLAFSVSVGIKIPPSLRNMYKELERSIPDFKIPSHGNLLSWSQQGVLLLNASLSVQASKANSHSKIGWDLFTTRVIELVNVRCENVVFMLWGAFAQKKCAFINENSHLVLKSSHPSPLSVYRGFAGCNHFADANTYLVKQNRNPIDWSLKDI